MAFTSSNSDDFEMIDHLEGSLEPDALAEAQAWLQSTDYMAESSEFRRHLSSQAPGTGLWICDTPRFCQWHDSDDHGSLWVKGVPGAGKSVIAASVIEHLKSTGNAPILFFFFRYIVAANRRPRSLVRDWLAQLLPHSLRLQATLQPLLGGELEELSDEQLWGYLLIGLSSIEKAYCIVDAMDEMELVVNDGFFRRLNSLATFRPKSVKLFMTSRPTQYLQSSLRDASIVHISLEHGLVEKDIAVFISHRLRNVLPDNNQKELRNSLESTICVRSQGLFLYARLLLDQIVPTLRSTQQLDVKKLASTLPIGLEDMYNSMLFQQARSLNIENCIQVFLLECVTHSSRPLRLNELASVLGCVFTPSIILGTPKAIARSACAPLLEILEDETVQVIHHSFTEFLLDARRANAHLHGMMPQFPVLNAKEVQKNMVMACLNYLQSGVMRSKEQNTQDGTNRNTGDKAACECDKKSDCDCEKGEGDPYDYQEARLRHPFLEYAVSNWAYHASRYDIEDEDFFRFVTDFLDPRSANFRRWLSLEWTTSWSSSGGQIPSALHIAAFSGLTKYATTLLREGQSVHSLDGDDRTPLHWACRRGHAEMVSLLLLNGANPDAEDCRGVKPLHEAARKNYATIIKMLLQTGVDPLTPKTRENHKGRLKIGERSTKGETAVQYVCQQGHTESILMMLPFLQPETLEEVLCESCRYGKFEAVRAVLENSNVSPNSKFCGATALYLASRAPSINCVEALLARGADVNLTSDWAPKGTICALGRIKEKERTPIQSLVRVWRDENHNVCQPILRLLMRAGANLESKDDDGDTPLLNHFKTGGTPSQMVIKSLLEAGANISAVDCHGDTVLHRSLRRNRDLKILESLFDHGLSVNVRGKDGNTVLHMALSPSINVYGPNSVNEVIEFLLRKGALCNVKNDLGYTALEEAVRNCKCSLETFRLLLQSCPDAIAYRRCLWFLDQRKNKQERVQFIQELMSTGLSLESRDSSGRTALLANILSEETLRALVHCGARLDAVDSNGRGALHHFIYRSCGRPSVERLRNLVEAGLDPHKVDNDGNSILHEAVKTYQGTSSEVRFIKQLLDFGISVNTKNLLGGTPLHIHLEDGRAPSYDSERTRVPLLSLFQRSGDDFDINAQDAEGLTALHLAALRSEIDVARLLTAGADASILTNNGRSALHLACRARKSNIVGFLLQETGNLMIDRADSFGRTPLHDASTSGRPESVYYLLKSGANVTVKDSLGRIPLHSCAEFFAEQHIWSLLEHRNAAAGQFNHDRYRPDAGRPYIGEPWYLSTWAMMPSFTEHDTARISGIVNSLLAAGSDVYAADSNHFTPLDLALTYGCQEMVKALQFAATELRTSLQLNPKDARLQTEVALKQRAAITALHLPERPVQEVLQYPSRYLCLLDLEDVDLIAKHGGDITGAGSDYFKHSLLHVAAERGLTEIIERLGNLAQFYDSPDSVRALVQRSKKPNVDLEYVVPILHVACKRGLPNIEMLELLVDKCGVDVNARALKPSSPYGRLEGFVDGPTALHHLAGAQSWWQLDAVRLLVKKGANINARNEKGETPLHIASVGNTLTNRGEDAGFWRPACVRLLLDLGADPNALDDAGLSCLHKASSASEIMQILLQRGADLSAGKISPLFSAIQVQDLQALSIILDAGASPNSRDTTKSCQLHYDVKDQERFALFCASFPTPFNNVVKDSSPLVKLLIERGADLYAPLNDRETLIHYVFEHAEYEVVSSFLECADKIDFNAKDQLGRTVFLAACNWTSCLPGYRRKCSLPKATGVVIRLLGCGADIMAVDNDGRHALRHLFDNADIEQDTILQFLEHEASKILLNQKDGKGFSPLHCAFRTLRPVVCEALIAMGANLLDPDPTGATVLHHIASQCLRDHRPQRRSTHIPDYDSKYCGGYLHLWQKFLDQGGDINVRDNQNSPPLFAYLSSQQGDKYRGKGSESCCHVENFGNFFSNADVNARNGDGETASHIIARREETYFSKPKHDRRLFEFMVEKGLDPLAEDSRGRSSLDVVAACGKKEILDLFQYHS